MIDRKALADWNRANQKARDAYARSPIISAAVCEVCGHTSSVSICRKCRS